MCEENVVSALLLYYKGRMNIIIVREHVNNMITIERIIRSYNLVYL